MKTVSTQMILFLAAGAVGLLTACGGASKPSEKIIQEDLNTEIANYKSFLTVKEYEVEKSLTEDGTYSATLNVTAQSAYAEYKMQADVEYVKYDQGWDSTKCEWTEIDYSVNAYPSVEEMNGFISENSKISTLRLDDQVCTEVSGSENTITCTGVIERENPYITCSGNVVSTWTYDPENDSWIFEDAQNDVQYVLQDISGAWKGYGNAALVVSNFTEDSFDISCEQYDTDTIHVERVQGDSDLGDLVYRGTGPDFNYYESYYRTGNSQDVTVYINSTENGVILNFMIQESRQSFAFDAATIE